MPRFARTLTILLCTALLTLQGCYSFTGASLPPHINTVAVPLFEDRSMAGIAQLREILTRSLLDKIQSQSSLTQDSDVNRANSVLEGAIVSYSDETSQLGISTSRAVTNRITIVVTATFTDKVKNTRFFSQSFTGFADYSVGNYAAQQVAIQSAIAQVTDELFNKMISNW